MAKRYQLNYLTDTKGRNRWRKKYKGQTFVRDHKDGETKEQSYRRVLTDFQDWKKGIDSGLSEKKAKAQKKKREVEQIELWQDDAEELSGVADYLAMRERLESAGVSGEEAAHKALESVMSRYIEGESPDDIMLTHTPKWVKLIGENPADHPATWEEAKELLEPQRAEKNTIASTIKAFINRQKALTYDGEKSISRFDQLRNCISKFNSWYAKHKGSVNQSVDNINASVLSDYHTYLIQQIADNKISREYAKNKLQICIQFCKWAYSNEYIDRLPRNIGNHDLKITRHPQNIKLIDIVDFQDYYKLAVDRTKLYMLLQINCGMTSVDISILKKSEIDFKTNTLTRKRSKTAKSANVPTVTYHLWPETLELLKQEIDTSNSELALLDENGQPMRKQTLGENDKIRRSDVVASAYSRVRSKLKRWRKGAYKSKETIKQFNALVLSEKKEISNLNQKLLRATSATLLESHETYGRYAPYFLGHAPREIVSKHYVKPSEKQFKKACAYLRQAWGFPLS